MIRTPFLPALLAALVFAAPSHAQERKLPPVDEAAGDSSWPGFKKRLLSAIDKKDKQFLLSILDPKVRSQDERARGVATFRKQWELDAEDSPVWRELANALALGTAYVKRDKAPRELCAPYVLGRWPGDVEPVTHAVTIGRETLVQAEPSSASGSLGTLSHEIVAVGDWEVDEQEGPEAEVGAHSVQAARRLRARRAAPQPHRACRVLRKRCEWVADDGVGPRRW